MKKTSMEVGEILETIAILLALVSLIPVAYWWHMDELSFSRHGLYFCYLFFMLCLLGYVTYRRVKRLRAALRSSKKRGGPRVPPFFQ
jgi:uncharacterized membrane protein